MRHTFATTLLSKGVDIRTIADIMGHANVSSTMRYAKVKPPLAAEAVNKLTITKH
jgi:site-specific recombinase XerD